MKGEFLDAVIPLFDLGDLGDSDKVIIDGRIREATALDCHLEFTAETLHRERPIRPNRATPIHAICNVEEDVDGEWAGGDTFGFVLIIEPAESSKSHALWKMGWGTYFS
jgi:hypothetical protein